MNANIAAILYLVSGVLFILSLRGLSSPATSQKGARNGIIGMAIAILTTLWMLWEQNAETGGLDMATIAIIGGGMVDPADVGTISAAHNRFFEVAAHCHDLKKSDSTWLGDPIFGVWLGGAAFAAAFAWMLRGFFSARWALLGGVLMAGCGDKKDDGGTGGGTATGAATTGAGAENCPPGAAKGATWADCPGNITTGSISAKSSSGSSMRTKAWRAAGFMPSSDA